MKKNTTTGFLGPSYEALIERTAKNQHLRVSDLRNGDVLTVVTENHRYDFTVLNAEKGRVRMVSNHPKYAGPYDGGIIGSLLAPGGSSVYAGRVAIGLCLVFASPALRTPEVLLPELNLSPTREVIVNGFKVLPAEAGGIPQ